MTPISAKWEKVELQSWFTEAQVSEVRKRKTDVTTNYLHSKPKISMQLIGVKTEIKG